MYHVYVYRYSHKKRKARLYRFSSKALWMGKTWLSSPFLGKAVGTRGKQKQKEGKGRKLFHSSNESACRLKRSGMQLRIGISSQVDFQGSS